MRIFIFYSYFTAALILACLGCSNYPDREFIEYVDNGFAADRKDGTAVITGLTSYRKTCIYGNPNTILKNRIDTIYQFLEEEFDGFSERIFTQTLQDCPTDTLIYIYLHESPFNGSDRKKGVAISNNLAHEYLQVFKRNNIRLTNPIELIRHINPWAFLMTGGDGKRASTAFIVINQGDFDGIVSKEDKKIYRSVYNAILTEELFQAISYGRDLNISQEGFISSILYEKNNIDLNGTELSTMHEFMKLRPSGFCEYDLWHLIISNEIPGTTDEIHSPQQWTTNRYKTEFIKNYSKIINRSSKILNNPKYTDLFDPLCSGNNRGVNSKVGH